MDLLKKCLIEFNNQWTNKITEKEVDDDEQLRFTLLDMQNFAKKYAETITVTHCCGALKKEETAFDLWLKNFKKTTYGYWYDENTIYCREAMQDIYKNEVKPTL